MEGARLRLLHLRLFLPAYATNAAIVEAGLTRKDTPSTLEIGMRSKSLDIIIFRAAGSR